GTQTGREAWLESVIAHSAGHASALEAGGRLLNHGRRDRPEVALTFDDGPLRPYTGQVLDVLERYGVVATFFCVGMNAGGYGEYLTRMRLSGHRIGNHTWSHPFLPELSRPQVVEQVHRTSEALLAASGATEDDATAVPLLLRPPYGA